MNVTPFRMHVPDAQLDDLRSRLGMIRWPADIPVASWQAGADPATVRRLAAYWTDGFDWRARESAINEFPHFTATVDGTRVHFVHLRGQGKNPLPIVLTHGWPSSFLELTTLGMRLAQPGIHGRDPDEAFDVVIPSLPGFGFSDQRPELLGDPPTHELWHMLMRDVLGYTRYGAHGGDLGAGVTSRLGAAHAESVVGIHLLSVGAPSLEPGARLTDEEQEYIRQTERWEEDEGAYGHQQRTRPLTLSYGLSDSPTGLLAWLLEKYRAWSDCDGNVSARFSDDEILTQVSLYWFTNTIATSFRPYLEYYLQGRRVSKQVTVPTALAVFPRDLGRPPRSWAERTHNVTRYTAMPRGGHFAAHEEPELLAEDISEFFRELR